MLLQLCLLLVSALETECRKYAYLQNGDLKSVHYKIQYFSAANSVQSLWYQTKEQIMYVCAHWRVDLITYVTVDTAAGASMCDEKLREI